MAPSRLSAQAVAMRETSHRGSAIAEARRSSKSSCLSRSVTMTSGMGAVRKRAVVQWFSWRHWLRALRKLLPVLMPGLSSVLEGVPNAKFAERSVAPARVAPATALRSDSAAVHTSLAIGPTQLSLHCLQAAPDFRASAACAARDLHLLTPSEGRHLGHTARSEGTPWAP